MIFIIFFQDDFVAGHAQQNGEQLNNLLKTLHTYYFRDQSNGNAIEMRNTAEFVCYFIIFQLGNGGEVSKYLQQLPTVLLQSKDIRFAVEVWGALKTDNYAKFFRLLRGKASLLQACLMHRYVGEVRLKALRKLTRTLCPPGKGDGQPCLIADLQRLFMFESESSTIDYLTHCGFPINIQIKVRL